MERGEVSVLISRGGGRMGMYLGAVAPDGGLLLAHEGDVAGGGIA